MFFNAPPVIEARPFTRMPKELELADRPSAWAERMARGPLGSFLEGPSIDRDGNLWLVDIAHGRIFRGGPDGLAMDVEGNLSVVQHGAGKTWLFTAMGEPIACIVAPTDPGVTNLAYGGPGNRTLYITESHTGHVLTADMEVPGEPMFSHRDDRPSSR